MMGEEKKIQVEEVDKVDTPPRARVTPETPAETFERKRDYLAGFLAEAKPEVPQGGADGQLMDSVIEALKSIYDPEIPVDIYELGLIYDVAISEDGGKTFRRITAGLPPKPCYDLIYRHALDVDAEGRALAFGSTTGNLWVSGDSGESWRVVSHHLPPVYCLKFTL